MELFPHTQCRQYPISDFPNVVFTCRGMTKNILEVAYFEDIVLDFPISVLYFKRCVRDSNP